MEAQAQGRETKRNCRRGKKTAKPRKRDVFISHQEGILAIVSQRMGKII